MKYQDTWINGKCVEKGKRDCDARYQIVKSFCENSPPKTVLDIGSNMNYFGLRLIEDFRCSVVAFEFDHFDLRKRIVDANKTSNLILLKRKLSLKDLEILRSCCHFDLVLAMSVMHHLPNPINEWIRLFKEIGDNVIAEYALEDSERTKTKHGYSIPEDGTLMGYGDSHLKNNFKRPIILL